MKYKHAMRKEKTWLEKGSYTGDIKTVNNRNRTMFQVMFRFFMTNNYLNITLLIGVFSFIFTGFFWYFFENSNAVYMKEVEGSFLYALGKNSLVKASCLVSAFITSFIAGYVQYNYVLKTKANSIYILGFILLNFFIYLIINLYFFLYQSMKYI